MTILIMGIVLFICVITVALVFMKKFSRNEIMLEVTATSEGKNELDQAIMKIYFTYSIGKLASRKRQILGSVEWSEGWMPVSYNLKENGMYREERLLYATKNQSYSTFEIHASNAIDEQGRGEGYAVLVLENPEISHRSSRAGVILAVTANMITYQLSDSTSWNNDVVIN
ncbi:hypothetical protein J2D69_10885 [Lysinibacillus sphaericus]|uniref:Uncharacterized protein n=2 Tax=Lysinibacillus TaxID=400634 RepID=W7RY59_LYSSH|nr:MULTISPECIES: hypothetical protein [Lysinibacillus]MBE5083216.1 hypothetical protein [Bacillus thuringiensis]AMO33734.1 hypothetical protein AR327_15480 [Lysinibacillus sphaericus]AMR91157.1 hypothetical protein A1T07_13730 [Lysinibacillus sphaericus]ANA45206.1 hypothetical protein A2J09_06395 [Lysinibacillus sphaericus]EWH32245.1 hypothetical protein P799_08775 [Lysinibacillus sphaericus CBAM5]